MVDERGRVHRNQALVLGGAHEGVVGVAREGRKLEGRVADGVGGRREPTAEPPRELPG